MSYYNSYQKPFGWFELSVSFIIVDLTFAVPGTLNGMFERGEEITWWNFFNAHSVVWIDFASIIPIVVLFLALGALFYVSMLSPAWVPWIICKINWRRKNCH